MEALFDLVDLEQGTPDWLAWRHTGIGASEADAILGRNRWKSPRALLREKLAASRTQSFSNSAMARGNALEPIARAAYCQTSGLDVVPACLQNRRHSWLKASVDGICLQTRRLVEIKCGEKVMAHSRRHGCVPDYYVGQLQHILAVTGFDAIDFWCWLPDESPVLIHVLRDDDFIAHMLAAEQLFWQDVERGRAAPLR